MQALKDLINKSKKITVFTGAGMSTESGIPDYRGPNGIWTKALNVKTIQEKAENATPNDGHYAIKRLYDQQKLVAVITQNIDQLHQKSGIPDKYVHELHGSGKNVVNFGDDLDKTTWFKAEQAIKQCDLLLVLGSSLTVYPAAGLVDAAQKWGIPNVIINYQLTDYDSGATLVIDDSIGKVLNECIDL